MKQKLKYIVGVVLLITVPHLSYGQYFQKLFDVDSSFDWGWDIFEQPDNNYFIIGWSIDPAINEPMLFNMVVSGDGSTVLSKNILEIDSTSLGPGFPGEAKVLNNGEYIVPVTVQWPNPVTTYLYSAAGFIKYNAAGDTIFKKTYTDTSVYYDLIDACEVMSDGGYMEGGGARLGYCVLLPTSITDTY